MEYENSIRKIWLNSFFVIATLILISHLSELSNNLSEENSGPTLLIYFLSIPITLFSFWILYHFSYKKRGTKWLMFNILVEPIGILGLCAEIIINIEAYDEPLTLVILACTLFIFTYFWINCIRLYRVNAVRKKQMNPNVFTASMR